VGVGVGPLLTRVTFQVCRYGVVPLVDRLAHSWMGLLLPAHVEMS
jgi:hypothetical protein